MSKPSRENLELIYDSHVSSISYRRSREQQIFTWSSAVFLAVISALIFREPKDGSFVESCFGQITISILAVLLVISSWFWQSKQRRYLYSSQKEKVRVQKEMGFFDSISKIDGKLMVPEDWQKNGENSAGFWKRIFDVKNFGKLHITLILGILAGSLPWL